MSLKVVDFKNIVEEFAPVKLKLSYDNVGLMVGELNNEIGNILVTLDCTLDVIEEAKAKNCNFIFAHHPLLYKKPSSITCETLVGRKILELIKNNISLYSAHTNLDSVKDGINDTVMKLLNIKNCKTIEFSEGKDEDDNVSGLGRVGTLESPITVKEMCNRVKEVLNTPFVRYIGEDSKEIKTIAVINGSGQDYFDRARNMGAECIITGDTTYHIISDYNEDGMVVIDGGHFPTEWIAFKDICVRLQEKIKEAGFENKIIFSEAIKDPYKIG